MGRHNRFGHPHDEVWSRLEARVPCALRTDRQGGVVVTITRDGELTATPTIGGETCTAPPPRKRSRRLGAGGRK
jgi:hypothetical protein